MKKYMPVLFVFTLFVTLLGFGVNTASATGLYDNDNEIVAYPGCVAGDIFSRTTGKPCGNTSTIVQCRAGDLFSSITGQRCTTTTTITPTRLLTIGSKGDDVRNVQQILKNEGYSVGTVDGKYGKRTARVVKEFQDDNDLPVTGNVDADTFTVLQTFGLIVTPIIPTTPVIPSIPESNNVPVISGVSGPQSLNVNQQGTWTVKASSSNGGNLSYEVVWGDEVSLPMTNRSSSAQQSATFTHSYAQAGMYKPTFTVRNVAGYLAQTSLSVNVVDTSVFPPGCTSTSGFSPTTGQSCEIPPTLKCPVNSIWNGSRCIPPIQQSNGETLIFTKKFSVDNTGNSVVLALAADNQYKVKINGKLVASSTGDWNFNSVHTHDITPYVSYGANNLEISVFNNYEGASETGLKNPAGLIYKITQQYGNNVLVASDGSETVSTNGGRAVLLSKQDPLWISIDGAKWIWSVDYYGGTTIPIVSERVKCVFDGSTSQQKCYTATNSSASDWFTCSGVESCVVDVKGPKGSQLTWKNSCGGDKLPVTTIDGDMEYVNFFCKNTQPSITASPSSGTLTGDSPTLWVDFTINNYSPIGGEIVYFGDGSKSALGYTTIFNSRHDYHSSGTYTVKLLSGSVVVATTQVLVNPMTSTQPSVTVLSPNGGETILSGSSLNFIKWNITTPNPIKGNLDITAINQSTGNSYSVLKACVNDSSQTGCYNFDSISNSYVGFNWVVDSSIPIGQYKIVLRVLDRITGQTLAKDASDFYFKITSSTAQPSITITSPDGGIFSSGGRMDIKWVSQNIASSVFLDTIGLQNYNTGSAYTLASGVINGGTLTVNSIPSLPDGTYFVYIKTMVNGAENGVVVYARTNNFTITSTSQPSLDIISPTTNQNFRPGDVIPIRWNSQGITGIAVDVQKADGSISLISTSLIGDPGSYNFTLSSSTEPGSYQVRVRSNAPMATVPFTVNNLNSEGEIDSNTLSSSAISAFFPAGCSSTKGYSITTGKSCGSR